MLGRYLVVGEERNIWWCVGLQGCVAYTELKEKKWMSKSIGVEQFVIIGTSPDYEIISWGKSLIYSNIYGSLLDKRVFSETIP